MALPFSCIPSNVDESFEPGTEASSVAEELALRKVRKVAEITKSETPPWIFGADTLIALDGEIYGKPRNRDDAGNMLRLFKGRDHQVISGIALYKGRTKTYDCRSVVSTVSFAHLTDREVEWYLDTGEWQGVAGSYRIQGFASCFITEIKGSFSSIAGLPIRELYAILRDNGYPYGG